jgi:hypothetical protein
MNGINGYVMRIKPSSFRPGCNSPRSPLNLPYPSSNPPGRTGLPSAASKSIVEASGNFGNSRIEEAVKMRKRLRL